MIRVLRLEVVPIGRPDLLLLEGQIIIEETIPLVDHHHLDKALLRADRLHLGAQVPTEGDHQEVAEAEVVCRRQDHHRGVREVAVAGQDAEAADKK